MLGFVRHPQPDLVAIGLLAVLAMIAELLQLDLYGEGTVSVSVAIAFAAGLIIGVPGVAFVSAGIALVHNLRRRPPLRQTVFNWATHVLAGTAPAFVTNVLDISLHEPRLTLLSVATIAAVVYFVLDTGLIATAIALSEDKGPIKTWNTQFRWLGYHYVVLCIMGLFLSIAYALLSPLGLLVFTLPVLMMRFAQKQYIDRTTDSVRELKRVNWELTQAHREIVTASQAIRQLNDELFLTLAKIIDARDPYVSGHAAKVAEYATAIGVELELSPERMEQVRQAALLHDIGKIGISERILHKPGTLTPEEYEQVKTHAVLGAEFLETSHGLRHLAPFVRHHHERWDGRGYPDGLRGDEIPLEARILAVCDAVEAMASDRPYHRAMALEQIVAEVRRCAGTQFNPDVAEAFIRVVERNGDRLVANSAHEVLQKNAGSGDPRFADNGQAVLEEREALNQGICPEAPPTV